MIDLENSTAQAGKMKFRKKFGMVLLALAFFCVLAMPFQIATDYEVIKTKYIGWLGMALAIASAALRGKS